MLRTPHRGGRTLLRVLLALVPLMLGINAATAYVWPPATFLRGPTSTDINIAEYTVPSLCFFGDNSTQVVGTLVRTTTTSHGCVALIAGLSPEVAVFGPLPPNTYTYEIYFKYSDGSLELRSSQQFVVLPSIPTLSPLSLILLVTTLSAIALTALKRG